MSQKKPHLSKLLAPRSMTSTSSGGIKTEPQDDTKPMHHKTTVKIEPTASSTSQYFSPRRTRNQIKIKYEVDQSKLSSDVTKTEPVPTPNAKVKIEKKRRSAENAVHVAVPVAVKTEVKSDAEDEPDDNAAKEKIEKMRRSAENAVPAAVPVAIKTEVQSDAEDGPGDNMLLLSSPSKQSKWQPPHWQRTLAAIRQMRSSQLAPVDTMGCHMCYDRKADEKTKRYQILVALMLSSQTKDQVTYEAMNRLIAVGATPANVANMDVGDLERTLYPVSFYKNKAKFLQRTASILIDSYDSDIPPTYDLMLKLPGVGPKMAHICMQAAWHQITGIGVDTHVHRITNRLRWTAKPTPDAERTRAALEQWLPEELWSEINHLLVGFGQTICAPTHPKCGQCANAEWCPSKGVKL